MRPLASCYVRMELCNSKKVLPNCIPSETVVFHDPFVFVSGEGDKNDRSIDYHRQFNGKTASNKAAENEEEEEEVEDIGFFNDQPNGFPVITLKNLKLSCQATEGAYRDPKGVEAGLNPPSESLQSYYRTLAEFTTCSSYRSPEGKHAVKLIYDEAWTVVYGGPTNASVPRPLDVFQKVSFEGSKAKDCDIFRYQILRFFLLSTLVYPVRSSKRRSGRRFEH